MTLHGTVVHGHIDEIDISGERFRRADLNAPGRLAV